MSIGVMIFLGVTGIFIFSFIMAFIDCEMEVRRRDREQREREAFQLKYNKPEGRVL